MRSRRQVQRERTGLVLCALVSALVITMGVFGLLAVAAINTGASMGYTFVATLAGVTALLIMLEGMSR